MTGAATDPAPLARIAEQGRLRSVAPLLAGFLLLIAVVAGVAWLVAMQKTNAAELRSSFGVRAAISELLTSLHEAETSQRGYLLTGDESYLAPYEATIVGMGRRVERIAQCIADCIPGDTRMKADIETLRGVSRDKLAELRETVELRRSGDSAGALALVRGGEGKALMERARALVESLSAENDRLLAERQGMAAAAAGWIQAAIAAAALLVVALAAYSVADARSRNRRAARANAALQAANRSLLEAAESRDRLEEQLRQSQKMEAMGHLTGGLAHDFNNMLAIVIGNLNLLKRRLERGEGRIEGHLDRHIEQALLGADRAATLTHRLLAFARKQPLAPEPVACNRLVAGMSELLRRTLGEAIRIETVLAGGLWGVIADANQLESAILNLAVNARDAMPDGGRLTIETANAHLDDAYAAQNGEAVAGQYVMLAVSDTGAGMPAEIVARAFDPFFTTKEVGKGTGLGLSQVYGFVRQSGGHVKIYSEAGSGTAVKIYLPRLIGASAGERAEKSAGSAASAGPAPAGRPEEIVLVVEDEAAVRRVAVEALRDLNYTVIHADGADAALRLLTACPEVALLMTDVVMPGMNGKRLADAAKAIRPGLPVLYTTGYTRNAIVHNGVVDADVQMLGKPYTLEQLARKVRQAIGS